MEKRRFDAVLLLTIPAFFVGCAVIGHGQEQISKLEPPALIAAPVPQPKPKPVPFLSPVDASLLGMDALMRLGDWSTTLECTRIRLMGGDCHEYVIPQSWADSKVKLAAFELSWLGGTMALQHEANVRFHGRYRWLGRAGQVAEIAVVAHYVIQNQQANEKTLRNLHAFEAMPKPPACVGQCKGMGVIP